MPPRNLPLVFWLAIFSFGAPLFAEDADQDTLDDAWELSHFGSTLLYVGADDPDGDGADNTLEQEELTNPMVADSDGDGLGDRLEIDSSTSALNPDSDGDGLCDGPGTTSSCVGGEDLNANAAVDVGESDPTRRDSDGGLSSDYDEVVVDGTNPLDAGDDLYDTDGDGLPDRVEWSGALTDSFLPDSDFDGLCDGPGTVEGQCVAGEDSNANGLLDPGETDPLNADSDADSLCDGPGTSFAVLTCRGDELSLGTDPLLQDSDGDGLGDFVEYELTHNDEGELTSGCPSPLHADSDRDGLVDGDEIVLVDDELVEQSSPCAIDSNGDGVFDLSDYFDLTSSPLDTDGDGLSDFFEASWGLSLAQVTTLLETIEDLSIRDAMLARYETHLPSAYLSGFDFTVSFLDPSQNDTDTDGLLDAEEIMGSSDSPYYRTNPSDYDSDDDGLSDWDDVFGGTSPLDADSDSDGLGDGLESGTTQEQVLARNLGLPDGVLGTEGSANLALDLDPSTTTFAGAADSDGDGLSDGQEDSNANGRVDVGETDPRNSDTDGDEMTDDWEWQYQAACSAGQGPNPTIADGDTDSDGDGLTHAVEQPLGTSPCDMDTDDDGLCDGTEVVGACVGSESEAGTQPTVADTDGDSISDGVEWLSSCLEPQVPDSDGDLLFDGEEDENFDGVVGEFETDPCSADTDGDGLGDGLELGRDDVEWPGCTDSGVRVVSNPLAIDSDGDGLCDGPATLDGLCVGAEDENGDGCMQADETSVLAADSDRDGLCDGPLVLGDGVFSGTEFLCAGGEDIDADGVVDADETNPLSRDTDEDHLLDGCPLGVSLSLCEDRNLNGVVDAGESDPRIADTDGGGIPDHEEVLAFGTDPQNRCDDLIDGDGDGIDDRVEAALGYDVSNSDSDNDTILDVDESVAIVDEFGCASVTGVHSDEDGIPDALDSDSDDDGIPDSVEAGDADPLTPPVDTDAAFSEDVADGVPDFQDLDSDGGGVDDALEVTQGTNPLDPMDDGRGELEVGGDIRGSGCAAAAYPSLLWLAVLLGCIQRRNRPWAR